MGGLKHLFAIGLACVVLIGCKAKSDVATTEKTSSSVSVTGYVQEKVPGLKVDYRQFDIVLNIDHLPEGTMIDSVVYNQSSGKLFRVNADGSTYKSSVKYIKPSAEGFMFQPKKCVVFMTDTNQKVVMHGYTDLQVKEKLYLP